MPSLPADHDKPPEPSLRSRTCPHPAGDVHNWSCAGRQAYVRTRYRRETGWFGDALRSRRVRIRVPGLQAEVTIEDIGAEVTAEVDAAYRTK
ncbi:DUF2255 family protein [Amycolatopsis sp. NPDC101161]|uniref:DUF2255 family protein n=1 Tax=Amycolatopsis sp. NPDC101161 TaxID=3363940 RepID=UPI00381824AE